MFCPIPWSVYCIPDPQGLLSLPVIFRKDFSHFRNSRGYRLFLPITLPYYSLNGQIFLSPHISIQHSSKNPKNFHWQASCLPEGWPTHKIWDYLMIKPPWPISKLLIFMQPSTPLYLRQTRWIRRRILGLKSSDSKFDLRSRPYDFITEYLTVTPKHARLTRNK